MQVSRLDMAERNLRQVRSSRKTSHSDDDYDEDIDREELAQERRRQTLLLVNNGPPLKRDLSHEKMNFLENFGLTATSIADGQSANLLRCLNA